MASDHATLVLRLAGPMQSWGAASEFNRRETAAIPTKSGIIGLLAAARGMRREDPLDSLLALMLGVRVDQPGTVLRDYHTVSDYRGVPLLSAQVDRKGRQRPTSPKKFTGVTQRFYLQDAVFVAVVEGERAFLETLEHAVRNPGFPLALGRRSCVPTQPLIIGPGEATRGLWGSPLVETLQAVPWQASRTQQSRWPGGRKRLPITVDADAAADGILATANDVPVSFDPRSRGHRARSVRHGWVDVSPEYGGDEKRLDHDPLELLGSE